MSPDSLAAPALTRLRALGTARFCELTTRVRKVGSIQQLRRKVVPERRPHPVEECLTCGVGGMHHHGDVPRFPARRGAAGCAQIVKERLLLLRGHRAEKLLERTDVEAPFEPLTDLG